MLSPVTEPGPESCVSGYERFRLKRETLDPRFEILLIVPRQYIFRPQPHLPVQAVHRWVNDLELKVLHAVFNKLIDAPAHVIDGAKDVAVEGELHAVCNAPVALAAGFERRHRQIQSFLARLCNRRKFFYRDGDLLRIAAVLLGRLGEDIAADFHFLGREPAGYPSFAVLAGALGGGFHPASYPNRRMGFLRRR